MVCARPGAGGYAGPVGRSNSRVRDKAVLSEDPALKQLLEGGKVPLVNVLLYQVRFGTVETYDCYFAWYFCHYLFLLCIDIFYRLRLFLLLN
jgi:hypothetical protein